MNYFSDKGKCKPSSKALKKSYVQRDAEPSVSYDYNEKLRYNNGDVDVKKYVENTYKFNEGVKGIKELKKQQTADMTS